MECSAKREQISGLFSVMAYDDEKHLFFFDNKAIGFGFLCWPLSGGDPSIFERLNGLLNLNWPVESILQFCLWTSPDLVTEKLLMPEETDIPDTLRQMREKRAEFLRQASKEPLDGKTLVRDNKLVVTARIPLSKYEATEIDKTIAIQLMQSAHEALKTCDIYSRVMTADDFIRLMETLLNWDETAYWRQEPYSEYDPERPICEQLVDYTTDLRVSREQLRLGPRVVKMVSPKRLLDEAYPGMADHYLCDPLSGSRGIPDTVLISAGVYFPDTERRRGKLEKERQWVTSQAYGPMMKFAPRLARKKESFDALMDSLDHGDRLVRLFLSVALFTEEDQCSSAVAALQTYWRGIGLQMMEDRFLNLPLFLNSLPFGAEPSVVKDLHRYHTMASRHAAVFLPLFADWKGTQTPVIQLIGRDGQLMGFDFFDSSSNFNCVIAAQSGSGKSFLTNEIITQYLSTGGRVWVLDIGRSYEKLAELLGGTFMVFGPDSEICLNPFPLVGDYSEEADMLHDMLATMAAPNMPLDDFQNTQLTRVLGEMWRKEGRNLTIDLLAEAFKKENDHRLQDLGDQLYSFTSAGPYGRFFNGPNTVDFRDNFIVIELEELRGRKNLQKVVLLLTIYQIQQSMFFGDRDVKKLVVVDEGWDLLTQGKTAKFIENGFRRFRKYGGAAIVVTQSINDLYASEGGLAIAENSATKILLGQASETISQLKGNKRLELGDYGYSLLDTVHTLRGRYSEMFIKSDMGTGVARLYVEPYKKLLYSTQATEIQAIKNLQNQGLGLMEAIGSLMTNSGTQP